MWPFPPGTPWGGVAFSQGAMIFCEFMWKYVLPPNAPLHYRLKDFKRGLMFGNPRRAKDAVCWWAQSPPDAGTHGIMDRLFDANAEGIGDRWAEHPNDDDMFAEVGDDQAGRDQTAIAKIITENNWGGPAGIFRQVLKIFGNPIGGAYNAIKAAFDAIMFLARTRTRTTRLSPPAQTSTGCAVLPSDCESSHVGSAHLAVRVGFQRRRIIDSVDLPALRVNQHRLTVTHERLKHGQAICIR
jgi:hypothetical protein